MRREDFSPDSPGRLVRIARDALAFVPGPLPEQMDFHLPLITLLSEATLALGILDGLGHALRNPDLLIRPFLRREAVASSRIEGTIATLGQLLLFEESETAVEATPDVREVANCVQALEYGLARPAERPISLGFIREMHHLLMQDVRGADKRPGEFRTIQNFIGRRGDRIEDARFVPPPPTELPGLLSDLERALAQPGSLPPLVRVALVHYQFEAIHPFLDGNGRVGRLLIPLLLETWEVMRFPQLLQLSDEIDRDRANYLDGLLLVGQRGDWDGWLRFFLDAVRVQARRAARLSSGVLGLRERYRADLQAGRGSTRLLQLVDELFERPTLTVGRAAERLGVSFPTAQGLIDRLVGQGLLIEVTGQRRNRVYLATPILDILNADPD